LIELSNAIAPQEWNSFVEKNDGTLFHTTDWLNVYERAGFRNDSLLVKEDNEIKAIFPLVSLRVGPFRKGYSLPLCPGGLLPQIGNNENIWLQMRRALCERLDFVRISALSSLALPTPGQPWRHVRVDLTRDADVIYSGFNKTLRAELRKGQAGELRVRSIGRTEKMDEVWSLYERTMKRHRSGGSYWPRLLDDIGALPEKYRSILLAYLGELPIAFNIFLRFGKQSHYFAAGSDESHHRTQATQLLLWRNILWSKEQGSASAHLGGGHTEEGNDSLYAYKSKWGEAYSVYHSNVALSWKGTLADRIENALGDHWRRKLKSLVLRHA
jgi:hypothetical protein